MRKIGIIDVGSNSVKGFVYIVEQNSIRSDKRKYFNTRLLEFVQQDRLTNRAIEKLLQVGTAMKTFFEEEGCEEMHAFATSALRSSRNKKVIARKFERQTGIALEVLKGEEEAFCDWLSFHHFCGQTEGIGLDLGGGSGQVVVFQNDQLIKAECLPIGVLRERRKLKKHYFPNRSDEERIKKNIRMKLRFAELHKFQSDSLQIMGGTSSAIYKLLQVMGYTDGRGEKYMSVKNLRKLYKNIAIMGERREAFLSKYVYGREDTVGIGILIILIVCEYFGVKELHLLDYGVREGYIIHKLSHPDRDVIDEYRTTLGIEG